MLHKGRCPQILMGILTVLSLPINVTHSAAGTSNPTCPGVPVTRNSTVSLETHWRLGLYAHTKNSSLLFAGPTPHFPPVRCHLNDT